MKIFCPDLRMIAVAGLLTGPAVAQQVPGDIVAPDLARFEAGLICAPLPTEQLQAPDTITGTTNVLAGPLEFVSYRREVPALLGIRFGVRTMTDGAVFDPVTVTVTHPPMGPEGVTRQSYQVVIDSELPTVNAWRFEFDYEILRGDWTISATTGEQVLYSAAFTVVDPATVPELVDLCLRDLLS